ncbi:hypothetical protein [Dankookia rubra]|nr:hypothetical protein [Dankookia rubra]
MLARFGGGVAEVADSKLRHHLLDADDGAPVAAPKDARVAKPWSSR